MISGDRRCPGPQSANVHSVDAIKDVRAALIKFQERATTAMGELRQKIDRTVAWLELDRPNYWRDQERRTYDLVASTRVALDTCRLRTVAGRRSDCIEEKKAYEKAKMRMEYVREKQAAVKKWMVQAGREANEYRARTSTFQRMLENDVPLMIAQLGRMIDAIEAYSERKPLNQASPPIVSLAAEDDLSNPVASQQEGETKLDDGTCIARSTISNPGDIGFPTSERSGDIEQDKTSINALDDRRTSDSLLMNRSKTDSGMSHDE